MRSQCFAALVSVDCWYKLLSTGLGPFLPQLRNVVIESGWKVWGPPTRHPIIPHPNPIIPHPHPIIPSHPKDPLSIMGYYKHICWTVHNACQNHYIASLIQT